MAGSRAVQENEVSKPPSAEAPSAPPLPFFVQRVPGAAVAEEDSSGDEVCYDAPLLAPRQSDDVIAVAAADRGDRGALARAKMQTLGCAKKDRKASAPEDKKGRSMQITSTAAPRDRPDRPPEPAPEDADSASTSDERSPSDRPPPSTTSSTTWWAQFFLMKHGFGLGVASLKVSLARLDLSDTDLPSLTAALEKLLQQLREEEADSEQRHRAPVRLLLELDLSDNDISDVGAVWLFGWLMQRPGEVRCRVLRMARNRVSDTSLEWLSALVCQQHSAIEELHLAENAITATGAAYLLLAFALHPFEAYPFLDPRGLFAPANVTLDRNPIEEPGLLARLRLRSNLRAACKDGNLRTSNFKSTPHVQLGAAFPDGANRSTTVLPLALEKVCAGGSWPSLPQLPKPQVKDTSGHPETFDRDAPRGKTFRRELLVDDEEGAGLELETVSDGLRICEIMEIPGQPGLRLGDIIVAIDGLPLWWHACQGDQVEIDEDDDAPSARFRARFRRGARLDILRNEAPSATATRDAVTARSRKRFACPVCWDSFDLWSDCLEHLREFGHEPQVAPTSKLEDASGCLRRWMATCMAAARGELPRKNGVSAEKWMAVEEEKAETLLLPASIGVLGERSRMVVEALAEEASRFGFEQGCTVWTLPNGLRAQCPGNEAAVAAIAEQLLQIMHFYLPDVDDKETLGEEDEELAEWTAWLEQMLQQQAEETRRPRNQPMTGPVSSRFAVQAPSAPVAPAGGARLLLLCGLPGSGKSTLARSFAASPQWCVVNQDSLGSRQACMKVARHALASDRSVVIDRCNVTRGQRAIWTLMASEFNLAVSQVGCVWLDVSAEDCGQRVLQRFGHRTLPPRNASLKVIRSFARRWQAPEVVEGFGQLWRLASEQEKEMFLAEFGLTRCELRQSQVSQAEAQSAPQSSPKMPVPTVPATSEQKEALAVPPPTPTPKPAPPAPPPVPARKEKVGSNKIAPPKGPVTPPVEEPLPPEPLPPEPLPATWSCSCGEINKLRRDVCNNCGAAQPRTDVTVRDAKPASVAAPNGADVPLPAASAAAVDAEPVAEASSAAPVAPESPSAPEVAPNSGSLGTADFWRLPMPEFDDLSPPK